MRRAFIVLGLAMLTTLPSTADAVESLPAVADEHGGHQLTEKENFQRLMEEIGADKDPTAPPVGDAMTPELLAYLTRNMSKLRSGDVCYLLYPIAAMKFKEARGEVLAFMAKYRIRSEAIYSALQAIGEPVDAVALAKMAARPWSTWANTQAEKAIETLAGENAAIWRQVAEVDDPRLKALAARHMLGAASATGDELATLFKSGPVFVRQTMLEALSLVKRPEMFPVILLALEDPHATIASSAVDHLKGYKPSDSERRALTEAAERLYATGVMHPRLTAARLAACLGDPRGFDWALECLQDFNDSGQERIMMCTNAPDGIPGDAPLVFLNYDRPGFPNFLRLLRKGEKPQALRDVAYMLSPRDDHGRWVIPVAPTSDEGKALRRGLEEIGTDLSREVLAGVFKEIPRPDLLAGLSEEEKRAAPEASEKDFVIEVGRRPFDKPDMVEFRLKKVTPGIFVSKSAEWSWSISKADSRGHFGGFQCLRFQIRKAGQGETVCAANVDLGKSALPPDAKLNVEFRLRRPEDHAVTVQAAFSPDQLRLDTSRDLDEFVRCLNSPDAEEANLATGLFGEMNDWRYKPVALGPEVRTAVRAALMKKIEAMAFADSPEDYTVMFYPEVRSYTMKWLYRCMNSVNKLGMDGIDDAWFLSLLDAKSYLAAEWAYNCLWERWSAPNRWDSAKPRILELLHDRAESNNPYVARNAALLLGEFISGWKLYPDDLGTLAGRLAENPYAMVRAAAASLAAQCLVENPERFLMRPAKPSRFPEPQVVLNPEQFLTGLAEDADPLVARIAILGLVEVVLKERHADVKAIVTLYERLLAGGDKDRVNAVREAMGRINHPVFVPLLYRMRREAAKAPGLRDDAYGVQHLGFPLDSAATAFLMDRLAEDPSDKVAAGFLVSGGYVWPPDTRPGRLQKLVRQYWPERSPITTYTEGAVVRLLVAEKDDRRAADAFAVMFRKHLREGDYRKAAVEALILASLGQKTDAPFARLLLVPEDRAYDEINQPNTGLVAVLALYVTDRGAARAPLLELLREGDLREHPALVAFARKTNWPDVLALVQEATKE